MQKPTYTTEEQNSLKKRLRAALAMLLVATILMSTTSYAWFVLSTAPEVTGISTNVGANGSLEIALLNADTREDMSTIRAGAGDSMAANNPAANNAWGNLVDLGYVEYGLNELLLLPARLNVTQNGENYLVDPGLLAVPTYGFDGRIVELTENTVSAIYQDNAFSYSGGRQDYGVRAIGTSDALSVQGSALATAKSIIGTNTNSAKNNAQNVLTNNGDALFSIMLAYAQDRSSTFGDEERDALKTMLVDLEKSLTEIDTALRQGLVAYAASAIDSEDTFNQVKDRITDKTKELKAVMNDIAEVGSVPAEFSSWVNALTNMQNNLNAANIACDGLTGGTYTWDQIQVILNYVMNVEGVYIGEKAFNDLTVNDMMALIGQDITMTLAPGSGIFADIADFTDNYSALMKTMGMNIEISTTSKVEPKYLTALKAAVETLNPAGGGEEASALPLTATYGYALDLAFRCNAVEPDLLLQTAGVQRVYSDSTSGSTQGGGSYMEFSSTDESMTLEAKLKLMDAIRAVFIDTDGMILAVAKPSITARSTENGMIKAPLYLYDYSFVEDEIGLYLTMGERLMTQNKITDLVQNKAQAVSVVVYLDGDIVDNTMVSATESASLSGVMNLQFATSANLVAANDNGVRTYTGSKTELDAAIEMYKEIAEAGQVNYTTVSWTAFYTAYERALAVSQNDNAGAVEIRNATTNLVKAARALAEVSPDAVVDKASEIRTLMGRTEDVARYVIDDGENGYLAVGGTGYTEEEYKGWDIVGEINRVDYQGKNMVDEGNGVYTTVYSQESWDTLAAALYDAEAVTMNPKAGDEQLNAAITALDQAEKALERNVFFKPYDYQGNLYYEAICDANNADSYGKWYDSSYKRIFSDVTVLNLDAYATPTTVSEIGQNTYVASEDALITPDIQFLENMYPELRDVNVKGVKWDAPDAEFFTQLIHDHQVAKLNELIQIVTDKALTVDTAAAQTMVDNAGSEDVKQIPTAEAAANQITALNNAVVAALEDKQQAENVGSMTAEQRILLTAAVNNAKAVADYESKTALKTAAEAAEALLTSEAPVTADVASAALTNLNKELQALNAKEVTETNTLTQTLPEGFGEDDIVYVCEYPGIKLALTGKSGETTIGAQILTEEGIVVKVSKTVTIYDKVPEDGLKYTVSGVEGENPTLEAMGKGDVHTLSAKLLYPQDAEDFEAGENDKTKEELVRENIKSYTWASSNTNVVEVENMNGQTCTIKAVGGGAATVSLSVETVEGNFYTVEILIVVNAPVEEPTEPDATEPEEEPTEPTEPQGTEPEEEPTEPTEPDATEPVDEPTAPSEP